MSKIGVWILLLCLFGIAYLSFQGAAYLDTLASRTLSSDSPIQTELVCSFPGQPLDPAYSPSLPDVGDDVHRAGQLPDYADSDTALSEITLEAPAFVETTLARVDSAGFSGLAPPRLSVSVVARQGKGESVELGSWPLQMAARVRFQKTYWEKQLRSPLYELARLEKEGDPAKIARSRHRVGTLRSRAALLSRELAVVCQGELVIASDSRLVAIGGRWLGRGLTLLTVVFGGLGLLLASLYLMSLKAGDIES